MKNWMKFIETLAGKLTAILAFAALIIALLALVGGRIPAEYRLLVYILAIGAMVIFTVQILARRGEPPAPPDEQDGGESEVSITPAIPSPEFPVVPVTPVEKARADYLGALIDDFRPLSLAGMDTHSGDTKARLALEDIYVSLNTITQVEKKKVRKKGSKTDEVAQFMGREESRPLSTLDALTQASSRRMVLLGFPGTGKSTFVRYLSLRMAQQLCDPSARRLEGWPGKPLLPVAISLGRFAETLPPDARRAAAAMLENFIKSTLESDSRMKEFAPHILSALETEGGLFLFDGLDEVANLKLRPVVVQAVGSFVEHYSRNPHSRFLVTCRTYSYQDASWQLTDWPVYELALFTPEQIEQFIRVWYDLHTKLESGRAVEYAEKRTKLLAAVQPGDPRRLYEVAPFPIILTMMAIVHASYELPDSRAQVYEQCVELLLEKWQSTRSIMGRPQTRSLLAELNVPASKIYAALYEIAYEVHKGHDDKSKRSDDTGSLVTEGLVLGILHDQLQDTQKENIFLEYCQKANGLLMLRGRVKPAGADTERNIYTFPHLTFEEYLASRHLKKLDSGDVRNLLDGSHDRWREAVKFMAEFLCFSKDPDRNAMNGLLEALTTPFPARLQEKDWRALWLAGELLVLYRRAFSKESVFERDIIANLHRLVETAPLSMRERADAADVLDQLWQPNDLYQFISIPSISYPLSVAKYPVTNAQYERFLNHPHFAEERFWTNFPRFLEYLDPQEDKKGESCKREGDWGKEGLKFLHGNWDEKTRKLEPRTWRDPRFGISRKSAPLVGISWYEANAYCKWLLEHWSELDEGKQNPDLRLPKLEIRLPTEVEWIAAAGGEQDDRYAWGVLKDTKEITRFANTSDSGIGRTTPVWMYPQGESHPYKIMDMSGNVWEWQANFYDKDHDWPAWRGGSWDDSHGVARCADRARSLPHSRLSYLGFRVVLAPHL